MVALRLAQMLPLLLVVTFAVFSTTLLLPGDPALAMLGEQSTAAQRSALRHEMGFDLPIPVQYGRWLEHVAEGDLGRSLITHEPVAAMLAQRAPLTLELAALSVLLGVALGVPAGTVAAVGRGGWVDVAASVAAQFGMAVPVFWGGILLILAFSVHLAWLPSSGFVPLLRDPLGNLRFMVLPSLTLGAGLAALVTRQTRAAMLDVLGADFIRTARAKGARPPRVVLHHALRNALLPVITVVGLQIGTLLGGTVITETVFSLSGLGRMVVDGIFQRDLPAVQGAVLVIVLAVLAVNLLTDLAYGMVDVRVGR